MMKVILSVLLVFVFALRFIAAIPAWEGMNGRNTMGSLIPGVSSIHVMGPSVSPGYSNHLSVHVPGQIGNLTILSSHFTPPLFYINQSQLWLLVNETTIYPVNVHNSTGTHELPMQLILGRKREGIMTGAWRWKATQLYYDTPGDNSNLGLYFHCLTDSGYFNIFMTFIPTAPPNGCQIMTLHSFLRSSMK